MKTKLEKLLEKHYLNKPLRKLGCGSFSNVYEAVYHNNPVVYKVYKNPNQDYLFFKNEIAVLKILNHPCIPKYYYHIDGHFIKLIVLEKSRGIDLYTFMQMNDHQLSYKTMNRIGYDILNTISYLHSLNVIHLDIKPENIMIDPKTKSHQMVDFGLSIVLTEYHSVISGMYGTIKYMAPEIKNDKFYGLSADIYSYGILLVVMFTRREFSSVKLMYRCLEKNVPGSMFSFIMKCLSHNPQKRPTASEAIVCYPMYNEEEIIEKYNYCLNCAIM